MQNDIYYSINNSNTGEFKDRGSKFIAIIYPFTIENELAIVLEKTKKLYPKANHYCYAYRIGSNGENFRSNDDGEPSGSAGKPILNALISKQLTNVIAIVVRYFGGTELGVPGLINAYKSTTLEVISLANIVSHYVYQNITINYQFENTNLLMRIIKNYQSTTKGIIILNTEYMENDINATLNVRLSIFDLLIKEITNNHLLKFVKN